MKTTDSVMREKYRKIGAEIIRIAHKFGINEIDLAGELGTLSQLNKDLASHSLAEARREEQERILTMAHNIRSELKEPGYISLTRLEVLLTGDNPERKEV